MAELNRFQQKVVAAYVAGRRRVALRAGWGAGKSYALGWCARLAGERGNNVMWVTDTGPHIDTIIQPAARILLEPAGWRYNGDQRVWRKNGVDIWLRSYFRPSTKAAESNSAEGSNVGLVLLDECQMWANNEPMNKLFGRSRIGPVPPAIVMAGLPIYNAWWEDAAKTLGGAGAIVHGTSFDNHLLRPEWFDDAWDTLGEAEYRAMLLNQPRAPEGVVYDSWSPDDFPAGNVLRGWQYSRDMHTVLAIDFGARHPCCLVLAHDPDLGVWVICGEVNPREPFCKTPEFARQILHVAWPRHIEDLIPDGWDPPFRFDDVVADPAGRQRRRDARTGEALDSELQILGEMPECLGYEREQGIGFTPRILVGKGPGVADRLDPRSGITRVHMAFGKRLILCEGRLWDRGRAAPGKAVSFAKAVLGYRYGPHGDPLRTQGHDHPLDALRYWVRDDASGLWGRHPMDERHIGVTDSLVSNFDDPGMW